MIASSVSYRAIARTMKYSTMFILVLFLIAPLLFHAIVFAQDSGRKRGFADRVSLVPIRLGAAQGKSKLIILVQNDSNSDIEVIRDEFKAANFAVMFDKVYADGRTQTANRGVPFTTPKVDRSKMKRIQLAPGDVYGFETRIDTDLEKAANEPGLKSIEMKASLTLYLWDGNEDSVVNIEAPLKSKMTKNQPLLQSQDSDR